MMARNGNLRGGCIALASVMSLCVSICSAQMVPLGLLPDGSNSIVTDMSSDGTTVLASVGNNAFYWRNGAWQTIPTRAGVITQRMNGVSGDGLVFVGNQLRPIQSNPNGVFPVKWSSAAGWVDFGTGIDREPGTRGAVFSNSTGTVAAGDEQFLFSVNQALWGFPAGGSTSNFSFAIPADQHVMIGLSDPGTDAVWNSFAPTGNRAYLSRISTTPFTLTRPAIIPATSTDVFSSVALASSCDGSVFHARIRWLNDNVGNGDRLFRWTTSTGFTPLPTTVPQPSANSELSSGGIIWAMGNNIFNAQTSTTTSVSAYLNALGVDTTGWTGLHTTEVSCDGKTFAGIGTHTLPDGTTRQEAFVAKIPTCIAAPTQLTMWLPFDNSVGTLSSNIAGAGGGPALLNGGPSFASAGKVAGARRFNGLNTQFASVPSYPGIQIGTNDFTIDMWVKLDGYVSGLNTLIDKRSLNPTVGYSYFLFDHDSNPLTPPVQGLQLAPSGSTPQNYFNTTTTTAVPNDGAWHFIAVSVDRSGNATFKMDAATSTVNVSSRPGNISNFAALKVAGHFTGSPGFKGWIDEVEIFCRALTNTELDAIYTAGAAGKCKVKVSAPWDTTFCSSLQAVNTSLVIQNLTGSKVLLEMHAGGVGPGVPSCTGPTPVAYTFPTLSPTAPPSLFSANPGITALPISITRDPSMTPTQAACFQVYGVDQASGQQTVAGTGRLLRNPRWCVRPLSPGLTVDPSVAQTARFRVENTGPTRATLNYRIFTMASSGSSAPTPISLNGLAPDQDVVGSITLDPSLKESIDIDVSVLARTVEEMPADISLAIDLDGDGQTTRAEAVSSIRIDESVALILDSAICNSIDFNNDGLFPADQDLIDFLVVLAGGTCGNEPNCDSIDFNNDGLFPDDNDVIAFLRVLAGGEC
jgi:hypothetical protein